jgi:hypothetical protein
MSITAVLLPSVTQLLTLSLVYHLLYN